MQTVSIRAEIKAVTSASASISRLSQTNSLDIVLSLPLRNQEALTNLLEQIYDPTSPNFHHYLTPQQFAQRFGPSEADYQSVIQFAGAHGLAVVGLHSNRTLLQVRGSVAAVESAFNVHLGVYSHPTESRSFFAPDTDPTLDLATPILSIAGLDNYHVPHPKDLKVNTGQPAMPVPNGGSGTGGYYFGSDFRNAYAPGVSLDGAGQSVALLEFDGYYTNDIIAYARQAGMTNVPLENVLLDNFDGSSGTNGGEVSLDIELAMAMAPGLSHVIVYEAGPSGVGDDLLNRIATDNLAKQISNSWNFGTDPGTEQIFLQFAAQGQTFFCASGDKDAYVSSVPDPDGDPNITVVGGTVLSTTGTNGAWAGESVWNQGGGLGSSGGVSSAYPIPVWQQGINMTTNHGSTTYRNIPDVAMVAENIQVIFNHGTTAGFYGTSCAAPLWAGFMALVNEQAAVHGRPPAGFINPAIYAIGTGTNYGTMFHDITSGNNFNSASPNLFSAVPGYDLCTGWGTPGGSNLITALATPEPLYVVPIGDVVSDGSIGGPFEPASQQYAFTNFGSVALNWQLSVPSNWLGFSSLSGVINPGSSTTVTATLNGNAAALPVGTYTNIEYFTNRTDGSVQTRKFILSVWSSLVQNGGFETGDFTGWTQSGNTSSTFVARGADYAYSGIYGAELGPGGSLGYLSQTTPTSPGQPYLLSLWMDSPDGKTNNEFSVAWNGATLYDRTDIPAIGWTNLQYLVTSDVPGAVLEFGFRDDVTFLGLDDVSLVAVPTPLIQNVFIAGGQVRFNWNALTGIKYQVQYQTNLLQTNWINLGNTITATNSSVFSSDALSIAPQRFYRLLLMP